MKSYVYVITDPSGYCKIGKANNVYKRLEGLQTGNPKKLSIYYKHPCKSECRANMLEQLTHARLNPLRAVGEWFKTTPEQAKVALLEMVGEHSGTKANKSARTAAVDGVLNKVANTTDEPIEVENVLETEGICE